MAVTTAAVVLTASSWTLVGAGPLTLSADGGNIVYSVDVSPPAIGAPGYPLRVVDGPRYINLASNVYAVPGALNGGNALVSV